MHSFSLASVCPLLVAAAASIATAQQTMYAIGNGGTTLIRFQSDNPTNVTTVGNFSGANTFLDALSFRPSTGQLYGYLDSTDSFYTVDLGTGALTLASAGASGAPTNTFQLGLAFNPRADRARIITDSGQNVVFNPNTGTVTAATTVAYGTGDVNEFANPQIIDNAYTQLLPGGGATQQYAIDYGLDALVRVANDAGTLTTVGSLGVNTDIYTGFDVFTGAGNVDTGYALLTPAGGVPSLYTIDLNSGSATLVGGLGFTNQVYSLAIVPSPAALSVLGAGFAVMSMRRRR